MEVINIKLLPATLVFENVWNLVFDIDTNLLLNIDDVSMQKSAFTKKQGLYP